MRGKFSSSLESANPTSPKRCATRNESQADVAGYIYTLYPVMVLVPPGSSAAVVEAKRREAENLRGRFVSCNEGLAFSRALRDVAVREPISRSSADLPPQLREVLGSIQVGHLTTPEATAQGLQMFALCNKKESKTDSPLKREVRQELFAKSFDVEAKKFLDEIRKQAMIEYKMSARRRPSSGVDHRRAGGHRPRLDARRLAAPGRTRRAGLLSHRRCGFSRSRARTLGLDVPLAVVAPAQAGAAFERALPVVPLGLPSPPRPASPMPAARRRPSPRSAARSPM